MEPKIMMYQNFFPIQCERGLSEHIQIIEQKLKILLELKRYVYELIFEVKLF